MADQRRNLRRAPFAEIPKIRCEIESAIVGHQVLDAIEIATKGEVVHALTARATLSVQIKNDDGRILGSADGVMAHVSGLALQHQVALYPTNAQRNIFCPDTLFRHLVTLVDVSQFAIVKDAVELAPVGGKQRRIGKKIVLVWLKRERRSGRDRKQDGSRKQERDGKGIYQGSGHGQAPAFGPGLSQRRSINPATGPRLAPAPLACRHRGMRLALSPRRSRPALRFPPGAARPCRPPAWRLLQRASVAGLQGCRACRCRWRAPLAGPPPCGRPLQAGRNRRRASRALSQG